jgi:hypothetical protein
LDLQDLGSIGEVVGAIGVVASLLYLAGQVRQARRVALAENVREAQAAYSRVFHLLADDRDLASIYETGSEDPSQLDSVDLSRFNNLLLLQFLGFVEIHTAHESGLMGRELYERWLAALASHLSTPGGTRWWMASRGFFKLDVVRSIDEVLGTIPPPSGPWPESCRRWTRTRDGAAASRGGELHHPGFHPTRICYSADSMFQHRGSHMPRHESGS